MLGLRVEVRVEVRVEGKDFTSIFTISSIFTTAFFAETSHAPSFRFEVRVEG